MTIRRLDDLALLGVDNARTRAYLSLLAAQGLTPARLILPFDPARPPQTAVETDLFDNLTPARLQAARMGADIIEIADPDINSKDVAAAVGQSDQTLFIVSGPGGAILKSPLLDLGKQYLHVHPGRVPDFRGSTTMYYSLLAEGRIGATAFLIDADIDTGPVVDMADFPPPADRADIDTVYDPYVRASLLARVIGRYARDGILPRHEQEECARPAYFVIHPVLKHIAILSKPAGES